MSPNGQTNELLGYPPDARLLILTLDDVGICYAENAASIRTVTEGVGTSATIISPAIWGLHGLHLLKENPDVPFGVHLTAICEYPLTPWKPLTSPEKAPSLVDEKGYLHGPTHMNPQEIQQYSLAELELEFRAQIETVLSWDLKPTHLDSHFHFHELRPDIFDLSIDLAREFGLALRAGFRQSSIEKVRQLGLPVNDELADTGRIKASEKPMEYHRLLRELPPGLSEWCMHAGFDSPELRALMPVPTTSGGMIPDADGREVDLNESIGTWQGRQADLDFLMSKETKSIIEEESIILLSYAPLHKVWTGA